MHRHQRRHRHGVEHEAQRHHVAHVAGAGGADEHPVEHEGRQPQQRRCGGVGQEHPRLGAHLGRGRHQVDHRAPEGTHRPPRSPHRRPAPRGSPAPRRAAAPRGGARQGLPDDGLGGKGEPVERVRGDVEELHQHLVGRQRHVAEARAEKQERHEDRLQHQRAQQDVGIDRRHHPQARGIEHARPVAPGGHGKGIAAEPQPERQPAPFGDHRGARHALHPPAEAQHEPQVERDVDAVHQPPESPAPRGCAPAR